MDFLQKLQLCIDKNNSLLSIGLDPDLGKIPKHLLALKYPLFEFNKKIIDATHNLVCAYKPNIAFYEAYGIEGLKSLKKTIDYLKVNFKEIPVILDAKRGDIGNTAKMYAKSVFEYWDADAITVNPYLGFDSIKPFLKYKDKGIITLCRTSNSGASDFQDLLIYPSSEAQAKSRSHSSREARTISKYEPLYIKVARKIVQWNQKYHNCMMVIGATWPEQLRKVREISPNIFFLVPGIGAQGGNLEKTVKNGLRKDKSGLIISLARPIIYASSRKDFAKAAYIKALELKKEINKYRT